MPQNATFYHPILDGTYYKGNANLYLDILMNNNSGMDITGFSQTLRFYAKIAGVEANGVPIYWNDGGGSPEGSIVRMNGWEDATYWDVTNEINTFSWDGSLPDTMNHTTSASIGWPDADPLLPRLRFYFSVPVSGADIVELCIDQSNGGDPAYDWLFPDASSFGGPYCHDFATYVYILPAIIGLPLQFSTDHNIPFDVNYGIRYDGNLVTGVLALDENANPIGTVIYDFDNSFNWFFDPPCEWISDGLSHTVTFYPEDEFHGYVYPGVTGSTIDLTVTESQPEILENFETEILIGILETKEVNMELNQYASDDEIWTYEISHNAWGQISFSDGLLSFMPKENDDGSNYTFTVRATDCMGNYDENDVTFYVRSAILCGDPNNDLDVGILDIVFIITALYKDGPGPGPLEISDVNNDGIVSILDVVQIINFKYKDGPALDCPDAK